MTSLDHMMSSLMWPFNSLWRVSYRHSIGNNLLSSLISELFSLENVDMHMYLYIATYRHPHRLHINNFHFAATCLSTVKVAVLRFIARYSPKTLECLSSFPADGLSDICYNIIPSLIQYIILHKPVCKLISCRRLGVIIMSELRLH